MTDTALSGATSAATTGQPSLDELTRACWITLPRRAAARGWHGLATMLADGHSLTGLGPLAGWLSLSAFAGAFLVGAYRPGFDWVFVESLPLMLLAAAIGTLSTQWGLAATAGFALGDFFVQHTSWASESTFGDASGVLAQPFLANLLIVRLPLLIEYGLLAAVAVGIPLAARSLGGTVSLRWPLPDGLRLAISAGLTAAIAFLLTRLWAASIPVVIRPIYTWTVDGGFGGGSMPATPVVVDPSSEVTIAWVAALAMLGRALVTYVLGQMRTDRIAEVEDELLAPFDAPPPPASPYRTALRMLAVACGGTLMVAGLIEDLWAVGVLVVVFLLAQLLQTGEIPFPPGAWRRVLDRIPLLVRFGAVLVVVNGMAEEIVGRAITGDSFQVMLWPVAVSVLAMAILVPVPTPVETRQEAF